jgi:hypothetical protein
MIVPPLAVTQVSGLGTGVATALAVNVGTAGAPVVLNGAGGTPSSLTLTNATGLPYAGVIGKTGSMSFNFGSVVTGAPALLAELVGYSARVEKAITITSWYVQQNVAGSIVFDTWKAAFGNTLPAVGDTMWGTKPNTSTAKSNSTTGLSIAVAAGSVIGVKIDSLTLAPTWACLTFNFTID